LLLHAPPAEVRRRRPDVWLEADVVDGLALERGVVTRLSEHGALIVVSMTPEIESRVVVRLWLLPEWPLITLAIVRGAMRGAAANDGDRRLLVEFVGRGSAVRKELREYLDAGAPPSHTGRRSHG
jgi:hypothetical protein